ncbi:MAG: ribose-phosphate pyrophosphokinase [Candidatus Omnitrophica bacterium]|nr:ribose-phosphate pyrophosphokinase [Candidatus Omnitrophota bacterium]
MENNVTIFSGNSNVALAQAICEELNIPLGDALVGSFPEGEVRVQINENIRGKDVYIIQSTCAPRPNDYLMELLIMIDAARRASARRITAVLPHYGYARQDRKDRPRVPITAKLIANLLVNAGANRILTMDLHAGQIQGFFDIPVDHLYSINVLSRFFLDRKIKDLCVVSPDVGGIKMARAYSKLLEAPLAIVDKRRESDKQTKVMNIIGDVKDFNVVIVDDLVSTGGSLVEAANALKVAGAKDIYACVVHPVLVGPAIERLKNSCIKKLVVTDTIPLTKEKQIDQIEILTVSSILADAIRRIHEDESVSALFADADVEA